MEDRKKKPEEKRPYEQPKVLATYKKEDLEEAIRPYGQDSPDSGSGGGCGCGGGSILIN
jgi:hypothetical protein